MITDERFDELVNRTNVLTKEVVQNLPETDPGRIFLSILSHMIQNEQNNWIGQTFQDNMTVTGVRVREEKNLG